MVEVDELSRRLDSPETNIRTNSDADERLQSQLRQAQKMEMLGTLVGGIAHDFNNILGIFQGHLHLLQQEPEDKAIRSECFSVLEKVMRRATSLVQRLLIVARSEEAKFERINIDNVVEELLQMLREAFPKIIVMSFSSDRPAHYITGDLTQLHQVLLNLYINARDAMPKGGSITLDLRTISGRELRTRFPEAEDQDYFCLKITDTGIGMDEATRSRIFEPYFSTKDRSRSSGLGLSMAYGIVKVHKGFVDVESQLGKGTTFCLYFPERRETVESACTGNEVVLFAEDEVCFMGPIKVLLEKKGYHLLEARDGLQAVETYQQRKDEIALVVLDIELPKMNGWDVLERLKEINPQLRVIVMSGYIEPDLKSKMLDAGVKEFLPKPFGPGEILKTIRHVIDSPHA